MPKSTFANYTWTVDETVVRRMNSIFDWQYKMHCPRVIIGFLAIALCAINIGDVRAQNRPRKFAPGVVKTIETKLNARSMFPLPMPMPGVNAVPYAPKTIPVDDTLFGQTQSVILYRDAVWELEFSFIGLRQARIRVPMPDGTLADKNFWYIVYRIRNIGKTMTLQETRLDPKYPEVTKELVYDAPLQEKIDFNPQFTLHGWVPSRGNYTEVHYRDVINPVALYRIQQLEDPNQRLLDTYQMSNVEIPMAKTDSDPGVWGVAIFEDVNPKLDFVSVSIRGLSNAFRIDRKNLKKPAKLKTLQLNFWRPGDVIAQKRDFVKYGIPLVDSADEQIMLCKRYRLPGPLLRVYLKDEEAERQVMVAEVDAEVSLDDLESKLTPKLDRGSIPASVVEDLERSGIKIDANATLKTVIEGNKWTFSDGGREFSILLEAEFWQPASGKIRFNKTLDHFWDYR